MSSRVRRTLGSRTRSAALRPWKPHRPGCTCPARLSRGTSRCRECALPWRPSPSRQSTLGCARSCRRCAHAPGMWHATHHTGRSQRRRPSGASRREIRFV
eukprot:scaffold94584_cov57-Phaeocystis_antarctica.AAC.3